VTHLSYLGVLAFVVVASAWLELALRTRVLRRLRRLVLTIACVLPVFVIWDAYAISRGHWTFDASRVTGITLPASIPLEELIFFVVVPFASVLSLEAVRAVHPHWRAGDEKAADERAADEAGAR
jgi:lycopene cyclase domain-containing protein